MAYIPSSKADNFCINYVSVCSSVGTSQSSARAYINKKFGSSYLWQYTKKVRVFTSRLVQKPARSDTSLQLLWPLSYRHVFFYPNSTHLIKALCIMLSHLKSSDTKKSSFQRLYGIHSGIKFQNIPRLVWNSVGKFMKIFRIGIDSVINSGINE